MPKTWFIFLIAFLSLRLVFWFTAFPNPDEAYYWLWGQHPGLSYYDHPPLNAWIQGLFTAILGRSAFALRLPNIISTGVLLYTYYCINQHLYGEKAKQSFWLVILLILASPLYFLLLALAWHDHCLIAFSLVSAYWFITFLDGYLEDGSGESWRLYGAAAALGLAGLCKYNAVFIATGFLVTLIIERRLRPLLWERRFYLATAIALIAVVPILLWNINHDFRSFQYYTNRTNVAHLKFKLGSCLDFILLSILIISPPICVSFIHSIKQHFQMMRMNSVYPAVAFCVFATSTVTIIAVSLTSVAYYYWNIIAYILLFPVLPSVFLHFPFTMAILKRKRLFFGTQAFGLFAAILLVVHYCVLPIPALFDKEADPGSRMQFGWENVASVVKAQALELGGTPFFVTTDYRSASALAYQLDNPNVTAISDRIDQFDFWHQDYREFKGRNAIILWDDWYPAESQLLGRWERLSRPTTISVTRFGVWIKNYYVLKSYGFKG